MGNLFQSLYVLKFSPPLAITVLHSLPMISISYSLTLDAMNEINIGNLDDELSLGWLLPDAPARTRDIHIF